RPRPHPFRARLHHMKFSEITSVPGLHRALGTSSLNCVWKPNRSRSPWVIVSRCPGSAGWPLTHVGPAESVGCSHHCPSQYSILACSGLTAWSLSTTSQPGSLPTVTESLASRYSPAWPCSPHSQASNGPPEAGSRAASGQSAPTSTVSASAYGPRSACPPGQPPANLAHGGLAIGWVCSPCPCGVAPLIGVPPRCRGGP